MARLTRATQKVFAGNATNNGVFGSLQAGSGQLSNDVETIQSLPAYEEGWNAATISSELLPPLEEFQGVQYANSYQQAYNFQEGIPEWDSGTTYYIGSVVKVITSTGYQLYHSLTDDNTGNQTSDQSNWELDFDSSTGYALRNLSNSTAITNCITAIPQDIKLEIDDSSLLVLKNGSKVYRGDGTVINITKDIKTNGGAAYPNKFIFVGDDLLLYVTGNVYSGDSAPSGTLYLGDMWYDTANKVVKRYDGSAWGGSYSLPICVCTTSGTGITSINQVFNGFGYIGSAVFVLPGVEGLIPNGRNADGSLNSTNFVTNRVLSSTLSGTFSNVGIWIAQQNMNLVVFGSSAASGIWAYNENENYNVQVGGVVTRALAGVFDINNDVITSFNPKPVFQAQDYHTAARVDDDNVFTGSNAFTQPITANANLYNFIAQGTMTKGETPSSNLYCGYDFRDINGDRLAYLGVAYNSSGNKYVTLQRLDNYITMFDLTNYPYTQASTPPSSDNSTKVATTAWVRSLVNDSNIGSNYMYVGNLLIQWGTWKADFNTFPRPFVDTNYGIACIGEYNYDRTDNFIHTLTTTGFSGQVQAPSRELRYIAIGRGK